LEQLVVHPDIQKDATNNFNVWLQQQTDKLSNANQRQCVRFCRHLL